MKSTSVRGVVVRMGGWKHWPVYFAVALGASLAVLAKPLGVEVWIAVVGICALHGFGQFWIARVSRRHREVDPLPKMIRLDQHQHAHHVHPEACSEHPPIRQGEDGRWHTVGISEPNNNRTRPTGVAEATVQALGRTRRETQEGATRLTVYHTARATHHLPGDVDLPAQGKCELRPIPVTVVELKEIPLTVELTPATAWERLMEDDD